MPDGVEIGVRHTRDAALISCRIEAAAKADNGRLQHLVACAYGAAWSAASRLEARHVVRCWNFIPNIHAPRGGGLDTYRVFNKGRYEAFERILGCRERFDGQLPTATGVGHGGADLVFHCLTSSSPGIHVENPRQIPAYCYSSRFGPKPPCFARATIIGRTGAPTLLVGGTASVFAETSMHAGNAEAQFTETLDNIASLIGAAVARLSGAPCEPPERSLARLACVRAYYTDPEDAGFVATRVRRSMPGAREIEIVRADICRDELSVEIEGMASIGP